MSKFIIFGGKPLLGEIEVSGAKNAMFPLIAAALLTKEKCTLTRVPQIADKQMMVEILRDIGVQVEESPRQLSITAENIKKTNLNAALVGKLRGSILLMGALLARCGTVTCPRPGGDRIGARPIATHMEAFQSLGARVEEIDECVTVSALKLTGTKVVLRETSVTGTENAVLAAVLAEGLTVVKLAAMEPHVQNLCVFLNKMGANISGIGTSTLTVEGVNKLHGADIELVPDSEEASSLITLAAATRSSITITNLNPDYLEDYLMHLRKMQITHTVGSSWVKVDRPVKEYCATRIQCGLYPKLNSDYLPPMSVLATQSLGETTMYEWLYENRLGHIPELVKMGAKAEILDPHQVRITGPTKLRGQKITTYDLRMGMTLIIAALVAEGQSEISDIHHIDRGYESIEARLKKLGAEIQRT